MFLTFDLQVVVCFFSVFFLLYRSAQSGVKRNGRVVQGFPSLVDVQGGPEEVAEEQEEEKNGEEEEEGDEEEEEEGQSGVASLQNLRDPDRKSRSSYRRSGRKVQDLTGSEPPDLSPR